MNTPNTVLQESNYKVKYNAYRTFIKLSQLPDLQGAYTLTKASMELTQMSNYSSKYPVRLRKPLQNWDPATITWNNQPGLEEAFYDFFLPQIYDEYVQTHRPIALCDITRLANEWYASGNYGLCLDTEDTALSEHSKTPIIALYYSAKAGLGDNIPHESMGAGSAGTGHVNLFNGNFALTRGITACNGLQMPISLTATYNSSSSDPSALNVPMGPGWHMSCDVHLIARSIQRMNYPYNPNQRVYT
ncbi:MAG TPA: DNRLRE domain-containing protein [Clostridia bacterium]|nr:DNRLRE domain-containing protein [Clostridia bacterium]